MDPTPEGSPPERSRIARAAGLVSALTLLSRLLGLVREQVFAALLGAGFYSDAYRIGYRIPNLLRDLFAEGALSAAFVPTFTDYLTNRSRKEAYQLANRIITLLGLVLGALVVLGMIFARPVVIGLAHGFTSVPGKIELATRLTRIMLPFLPLVSFAAVAMGMLNAEERFGAPALAPSMFNVIAIGAGVGFWALGWSEERVVIGWSVAVLAGGAAQYLVQLPSLHRMGWRFRPTFALRDEGLRRMVRLMAPATMGLAAVQLNIFINTIFASQQPGAVSWLEYAFRLLYLPIGIFGVAIGTIAGTGVARRAAARDLDGMRQTLRHCLRLLAFLTIPATVGLIVLAHPILRLLYERGRFTPRDTAATAAALIYYAVGLFSYSAVKVFAPAFYALDRPKVPLVGSLLAVATNLVLCASLYPVLGFRGVALGTSAGATVNLILLLVFLQRAIGTVGGHGLWAALGKIIGVALLMGALAWGSAHLVESWIGTAGLVVRLLGTLGPIVIAVGDYVVLLRALHLEEAREIWGFVARRLGR